MSYICEQISKIKDILTLKRDLRSISNNVDHFDNYLWREFSVWNILRKECSTFTLLEGRTGPDFHCSERSIEKGEIKSCQIKPKKRTKHLSCSDGKGEFDKQNDPLRRKETLEYDGFVFSMFLPDYFTPVVILHIHDRNGVFIVRDILENKQNEKIKQITECEKIGKKVSRDTVVVKFEDIYNSLLTVEYDVYYNGHKIDTEEYLQKLRSNQIIIPDI